MILTFEESSADGKLTPQQHADRLDNLVQKIQGVTQMSQAEAEAKWQRQRRIGFAYGKARNSISLVKVPEDVVLTPTELKLANWVFEYAKQEGISVKEAMSQILDYLKQEPEMLGAFTKGEASFSEFSEPDPNASASYEWNCTQQALHQEKMLRIYRSATGCSFDEAVRHVL